MFNQRVPRKSFIPGRRGARCGSFPRVDDVERYLQGSDDGGKPEDRDEWHALSLDWGPGPNTGFAP